MTTQELYNDIIDKLKAGKRPLVKLNSGEMAQLRDDFHRAINANNSEELIPILCILDNTQNFIPELDEHFIRSFKAFTDANIHVLLLGCMQKHIIEFKGMQGNRLSMDFLKILEDGLRHEDPEVLEWALRIIESMGSQGIYFKSIIKEVKPSMMAVFNKHKKAAKQIIEMLEKRWNF